MARNCASRKYHDYFKVGTDFKTCSPTPLSFFSENLLPFFVRPIPVLQLITVIIKFRAKGDNTFCKMHLLAILEQKKLFKLVVTINVFIYKI